MSSSFFFFFFFGGAEDCCFLGVSDFGGALPVGFVVLLVYANFTLLSKRELAIFTVFFFEVHTFFPSCCSSTPTKSSSSYLAEVTTPTDDRLRLRPSHTGFWHFFSNSLLRFQLESPHKGLPLFSTTCFQPPIGLCARVCVCISLSYGSVHPTLCPANRPRRPQSSSPPP